MINEKIKRWILKALNDIKIIEHEFKFNETEIVTDGVCFHSQQAVEKLLKAFLVSKNIDFGKTHNINLLLEQCKK